MTNLLIVSSFLILLVSSLVVAVTIPSYLTSKSAGTKENVTGFLADILCIDRRRALDGADMLLAPQHHSVHCLVDIQSCIDGGFAILQKSDANPVTWHPVLNFSQTDTLRQVEQLRALPRHRTDVWVTVRGEWQMDGSFSMIEMNVGESSSGYGEVTSPVFGPQKKKAAAARVDVGQLLVFLMFLPGVFSEMI